MVVPEKKQKWMKEITQCDEFVKLEDVHVGFSLNHQGVSKYLPTHGLLYQFLRVQGDRTGH